MKCDDDLIDLLDPKQGAPSDLPTEIAFGTPVFVVASEDTIQAVERVPRQNIWHQTASTNLPS